MSVDHNRNLGFETFLDRHDAALRRTARMLTGNRADAEDLLQDTLLLAHRRWRDVAAAREPNAYVGRMLVNCFLSSRRKHRPRIEPLPEASEVVDQTPDLAETTAARDQLARALAQLTERERTAVVLRHYLQLNADEIGAAMGTRASSARRTLSRGLASLRTVLASEPINEPTQTSRSERR